MQGPNLKGAIAETKIAAAATELGIPVLRPVAEHGRYDMVFDIGERLHRVQVKWGALEGDGAVVRIKTESQRCTPDGYVRRTYSTDEIDLLAVYCGELDRCFLLPADRVAGRRQVWLRLAPPGNGQRACINLAADHEFSGAVAQLEERSAGSRKVGGSNPPSSTPPAVNGSECVSAHDFRERFGLYLERAAAGSPTVVTRYGKPFATLVPFSASRAEPTASLR